MAKGDPDNEYKIASDNIRWYSNIRFAQLTLFFAITAALASRIFPPNAGIPQLVESLLKIGGVLSSLVFGYMEKRADDYWRHYMQRACDLEKGLGYNQYSTRPIRKLRTTHTILVLYGAIALFWLITLFYF